MSRPFLFSYHLLRDLKTPGGLRREVAGPGAQGVAADDPLVLVREEEDGRLLSAGSREKLEDPIRERSASRQARHGWPFERQIDPQKTAEEPLRFLDLFEEVEDRTAPPGVHLGQHLPSPFGDAHEVHPTTLRSRLRY